MTSRETSRSTYQLKIMLLGIEPAIWRRIQVPSKMPLITLHQAIKIAMGWTATHRHEFGNHGKGRDEFNFDDIHENQVPVAAVLKSVGDSIVYVYDFGDNWRHQVMLARILRTNKISGSPICLAGQRACPPEDVGGVNGYDELMEAIFDLDPRQSYEQFSAWTDGGFQPEEFDKNAVNERFARRDGRIDKENTVVASVRDTKRPSASGKPHIGDHLQPRGGHTDKS